MKNLSKTLIISSFLLLSIGISAQSVSIRAGGNFSDTYIKSDIFEIANNDIKAVFGIHFGVEAEFAFNKIISLESGLFGSTKGYKFLVSFTDINGNVIAEDSDVIINTFYAELPVNLKFYFDAGDAQIFGLAGAFYSYGLAGISKFDFSVNTMENQVTKIKWGDNPDTDLYRPFDFGLNAGIGFKIGDLQVSFRYNFGLANINSNQTNGNYSANRTIQLSAAYKLFERKQSEE